MKLLISRIILLSPGVLICHYFFGKNGKNLLTLLLYAGNSGCFMSFFSSRGTPETKYIKKEIVHGHRIVHQ